MNTKIIKPNLKEKQISSLRKKVLSKKPLLLKKE